MSHIRALILSLLTLIASLLGTYLSSFSLLHARTYRECNLLSQDIVRSHHTSTRSCSAPSYVHRIMLGSITPLQDHARPIAFSQDHARLHHTSTRSCSSHHTFTRSCSISLHVASCSISSFLPADSIAHTERNISKCDPVETHMKHTLTRSCRDSYVPSSSARSFSS